MTNRHPRETKFSDITRAFVTNDKGERVLVGLTLAETDEYFEHVELRRVRAYRSPAQWDRHQALYERHERARLAVWLAEVKSRRGTKK